MVRQAQSTKTTVRPRGFTIWSHKPRLRAVVLAAVITLAGLSVSRAESLASKNRQGNRFFVQGKYEEAERAYLDAEVNSPGRPEILYNLGNSLIKQKKYDQGIQSLRQSIGKGDKGTKESSWYNTGNAFYLMGNYRDAAEAFIQALKLDSTDRDAKHNLELALSKLRQQQQNKSDQNRKQQGSGKTGPERPSSGNEGQQSPGKQDQVGAGKSDSQKEPAPMQADQTAPRVGSINKERAIQILDAIQNQELEQQRKLLEYRARRRTNGKDW